MSFTVLESGLCECGCGRPAPLAQQTDRQRGYVRGEPLRFIVGHNSRLRNQLLGTPYEEQNRGHETPCWVWLGSFDKDGYGLAWANNRSVRAHRFFYERDRGPIPSDKQLDHLCRVRACVNPDHLEAVTGLENSRRGVATRLTFRHARAIKAAIEAGERGSVIASRFGISRQLVCDIKHGRAWRDA